MSPFANWLHRRQALWGIYLSLLLAAPPLRGELEERMSTHMLVQMPALVVAGALIAHAASPGVRRRLHAWNAHGIAGLTLAALVLALVMIPRLLDLVLVHPSVEAAKFAALLACGAALRWSWRPAGIVVQGFFLGNALPMMAIAGWLYETAPARVCNAYRLDEQQWLGQALSWVAVAVAAAWLVRVGRRLADPAGGGPAGIRQRETGCSDNAATR
jgi:hypothetical protein